MSNLKPARANMTEVLDQFFGQFGPSMHPDHRWRPTVNPPPAPPVVVGNSNVPAPNRRTWHADADSYYRMNRDQRRAWWENRKAQLYGERY